MPGRLSAEAAVLGGLDDDLYAFPAA